MDKGTYFLVLNENRFGRVVRPVSIIEKGKIKLLLKKILYATGVLNCSFWFDIKEHEGKKKINIYQVLVLYVRHSFGHMYHH